LKSIHIKEKLAIPVSSLGNYDIISALPSNNRINKMLRILIAVASLVLSLLAAEIIIRIQYGTPPGWVYPQVRHEKVESRYRMIPNQNSYSGDASVHTNSLGYRGEEWPEKFDSKSKRIWILGDSITLGNLIEESKTFVSLLKTDLIEDKKQYSVVSSAVMGWSTFHELEALKAEWDLAKPSLVVLIFFYNDFNTPTSIGTATQLSNDGILDGRPSFLRWLPYDYIYFFKKSALISLVRNKVGEILYSSRVDDDAKFFKALLNNDDSISNNEIVKSTLNYIKDFLQFANSKHANTLIVHIPAIHSIMQLRKPLYSEWIESLTTKTGGKYLDLYQSFLNENEPLNLYLYPWDNHLSEKGHELVAKELEKTISELK